MLGATASLCGTGKQWLDRQARDVFVREARGRSYVARSAFKLIEMDDKYDLFRQRQPQQSTSSAAVSAILDLGCSPGSWCQVVRERCGDRCHIIALDLLPVRADVVNASFLQGDFTDPAVQSKVRHRVHSTGLAGLDVVLSDMCPNRRGDFSDRQRQAALQLEALRFSLPLLRSGGQFVAKVLGSRTSQEELRRELNRWFLRVSVFKPLASRASSDEEFLIGRGKLADPRPPTVAGGGGSRFGLDGWPGLARKGSRRR